MYFKENKRIRLAKPPKIKRKKDSGKKQKKKRNEMKD
jgi:hypothetical protein